MWEARSPRPRFLPSFPGFSCIFLEGEQELPQRESSMLVAHAETTGPWREDVLMGRRYRVLPAVMIRSQVLRNNLGSVLLRPERITSRWAAMWKMTPVIVGDHPTERGEYVSARQPHILNARGVGFVLAPRAEREETEARLAAEVWIEEERAALVPELGEIIAAYDAGRPVELSTGFAGEVEDAVGIYNGEAYEMEMHPIDADHLAISTRWRGACAVDHGCGLGVNQEKGGETVARETTEEGATTTDEVPPEEMVEEQPQETEEARQTEDDSQSEEKPKGAMGRVLNVLKEAGAWLLGVSADHGVSDEEVRRAIANAIKLKYGRPQGPIIEAVYPNDSMAVYWWPGFEGGMPDPPGDAYYSVQYRLGTDGSITLRGDSSKVRKRVVYEPLTGAAANAVAQNAGEDEVVKRDDLIKTLVEKGPHTAEQLAQFSDCELTALAQAGTQATTEETAQQQERPTTDAAKALERIEGQLTELREANDGLKQQVEALTTARNETEQTEKVQLVEELAGNSRVQFPKDELEKMSVDGLLRLRATARNESFTGRGGARTEAPQLGHAQAEYAEPVPYWKKQEAAATN